MIDFSMWPLNLMDDLQNKRAPVLYYIKLCAKFQSHRWIQTGVIVRKCSIRDKSVFFSSYDIEIWRMTLKNNRTPLLCYFKLCASFQSHQPIQTSVAVQKSSVRLKIGDFLTCVTLKFGWWSWKTQIHLFYANSSFVHHFKAIDKFQLVLKSGNGQFGSHSEIFGPVWPWNLTDDPEKQQDTSSMLFQALCVIP